MTNQSKSGTIYLMGIGPGDPELLTMQARKILTEVDYVVGYSLYVNQVSELTNNAILEHWAIGEELERAKRVIDLSADGNKVAMVSSGDIGIYGMSGPIFNILSDMQWNGKTPQVIVIPGISALQSASALLGSPLMQDFCTISLSDLLTDWPDIQNRITTASEGDFVVVFYNPKSKKRHWQLEAAFDSLKKCRPLDTPVGLVKNAFREDQEVVLVTLSTVMNVYHQIDMFTTVVVGNSTSYLFEGKFITPRGYEKKSGKSDEKK
ncbi:MAG TPA: precorrin-3B C(17)-methyltransferase [Dehalococcoidia bacterium]|jgi:precorrin-3B C17-methyltransferase|nr:precorrin-3B C(17)-methyltransferase [Dehalococcoidia bacterium]